MNLGHIYCSRNHDVKKQWLKIDNEESDLEATMNSYLRVTKEYNVVFHTANIIYVFITRIFKFTSPGVISSLHTSLTMPN